MPPVFALLLSVAAPLFDVQTIPVAGPQQHVFLAQGADRDMAALYVLDGRRLSAYRGQGREEAFALDLPDGVTAFDVADVDGDDRAELVAVRGGQVLRWSLFSAEPPVEPAVLFEVETLLSDMGPDPFPYVIAVPRKEGIRLALPCATCLELRDLAGNVTETFPVEPEADQAVTRPTAFRAYETNPPQMGPPGSLDLQVSRVIEFNPPSSADLQPRPARVPSRRRGSTAQALDAAERAHDYWPWFPLTTDGDTRRRVLYALTDAPQMETLVDVRELPVPNAVRRAGVRSPESARRYPGALLTVPDALPDFNGDGYVDLVLWQTTLPGLSVDSLTRAVTAGTWPIFITTHLFLADRNRYDPRPAGYFTCRVPVAWFLSEFGDAPLQHVVLRDFDGDGRTDFGFSPSECEFNVRLRREDAFPAEPDFAHTFPEPIRSIEFCEDLDGNGCASLALRTDAALYVLRPNAPGAGNRTDQ